MPTRATPAGILWENRFNRPNPVFDRPEGIVVDPSGSVVVFGVVAVKYDGATGTPMWRIPQGISNSAIDSKGDLFSVYPKSRHTSGGSIAPDGNDIEVSKYSGETGKRLWSQTWDGGTNIASWVQGLVLDSVGNVVIAGFRNSNDHFFAFVAKFGAADGRLIWRHDPPVEVWHGSFGLKVDSRDDVVFASTTKGANPIVIGSFIEKLGGLNGLTVWEQRFRNQPQREGSVHAMDLDREGNVFVGGRTLNGSGYETVTTKLRELDGELIWTKAYQSESAGSNWPTSISVDPSGDVFVSVNSEVMLGHTLKYAGGDGRMIWDQLRKVPADSIGIAKACLERRLFLDPQGALVLLGNQWNGKNIDYHLTWLSPADGHVLREISYDGPAGDNDLVSGLAFSPDGGVVVTGMSSGCPEWLKSAKSFSHRLRTGESGSFPEGEINQVFTKDPYNYGFVTVKFPSLLEAARKD